MFIVLWLVICPLLSCEAMGGDFKNMKTNFRTPLNKKPLNVVKRTRH